MVTPRQAIAAAAVAWLFATGALWALAFRGGWWLAAYLTWLVLSLAVAWPKDTR